MRRIAKHVYSIVLVAYLLLVLWLTIYSREPSKHAGVEWQPFWTYKAIFNEKITNRCLLMGSILCIISPISIRQMLCMRL